MIESKRKKLSIASLLMAMVITLTTILPGGIAYADDPELNFANESYSVSKFDDETDTIADTIVASVKYAIAKGNDASKAYKEGDTIDAIDPAKANYLWGSIEVPVSMDQPNTFIPGNVLSFDVTSDFSVKKDGPKVVEAKDSNGDLHPIGNAYFDTTSDGKLNVKIIFGGPNAVFGTADKVVIDFGYYINYSGDETKETTVNIFGKDFKLSPPPPQTGYEATKSGAKVDKEFKVEWTIEVWGKDTASKLAGGNIVDDLSKAGEYVVDSFVVKNEGGTTLYDSSADLGDPKKVQYDATKKELTYTFPDDASNEKQIITYQTKLSLDEIKTLVKGKISFDNTMIFTSNDGDKIHREAKVEIPRTSMIVKAGLAIESDHYDYYPTGTLKHPTAEPSNENPETLTFFIRANKDKHSLENVVIRDSLSKYLTLIEYTAYKRNDTDTDWEAITLSSGPSAGASTGMEFKFGHIDTEIALKLKVKIAPTFAEQAAHGPIYVRNTASLNFDVNGENKFIQDDSSSNNLGKRSIAKAWTSAEESFKDDYLGKTTEWNSTGKLSWDISISRGNPTITENTRLFDLLIYDTEKFQKTDVVNLPSTLDDRFWTEASPNRSYRQKIVSVGGIEIPENGHFSKTDVPFNGGTADFTVYRLKTTTGKVIADLIEFYNIKHALGSDANAVMKMGLITQVVSPEQVFSNFETTPTNNNIVTNTVIAQWPKASDNLHYYSLSQPGARVSLRYMGKETLMQGASDDLIQNVDNYDKRVGGKALDSYNIEKNELIYRITINPNNINFSERDIWDAADDNVGLKKLGAMTFTDTLPANWEFAPFEDFDNANFLIFKAEAPDSSPNGLVGLVKPTVATKPLDISTEVTGGLTPAVSGGTAKFTFGALQESYVILLKAKPNATELARIKAGSAGVPIDITNTLTLTAENVELKNANVTQVTRIAKPALKKTFIKTYYEAYGIPKWQIDYLAPAGEETKIKDKLPEGLMFPGLNYKDALGNIVFSIQEGTVVGGAFKSSGTERINSLDDVKKYVSYDPESREITFTLPTSTAAKAYRIEYITYDLLTSSAGDTLKNEARLGDLAQASASMEFQESWVRGKYLKKLDDLKIEIVEIKKTDRLGNLLSGAEFSLTDIGGVTQNAVTEKDGIARFIVARGEYTLKEVTAPSGFVSNDKVYEITVGDKLVTVKNPDDKISVDGTNKLQINAINDRPAEYGLKVSKIVTGGDRTKPFTFKITGLPSGGVYPYTIGTDSGRIIDGGTFTLKHGETFEIASLPKGTVVTIEEQLIEKYYPSISVNGKPEVRSTDGKVSLTIGDEAVVTAAYNNYYADGTGGYTPGGGGGGSTPPTPPTDPKPPTEEPIVPPVTPGGGPGGGGGGGISDETIGDDGVPKSNRDKDGDDKTTRIQGAPKTGLPYHSLFRETLGQSLLYSATLMLAIVFVQNESARRRKF